MIFRIVTMRCIVFTLAFDSSPIKGEGDNGGCFGLVAPRHTRAVDRRTEYAKSWANGLYDVLFRYILLSRMRVLITKYWRDCYA